MTVVTLWNFYPEFEYKYSFKTITTIPENEPFVNFTPETKEVVYLKKSGIKTFLIKYLNFLSIGFLIILITITLLYLTKLKAKI